MKQWGLRETPNTLTGKVSRVANASRQFQKTPPAVLNSPRWLTNIENLVVPLHKKIQTLSTLNLQQNSS
ncbi:hypothetical protein [Nostoc sp.]|uniref:hypothetical protein n=1 Tax=Nostoc sp. TaxID=1180 RepID=UPI002FFBE144